MSNSDNKENIEGKGTVDISDTFNLNLQSPTEAKVQQPSETSEEVIRMEGTFEGKFKKAFLEVLDEPNFQSVLSSFENSYNYKCENSWEDEYKDERSLGYALHDALHGYPDYDTHDFEKFAKGEVSQDLHKKMQDILNEPVMIEIIDNFKHFIKNVNAIDPASVEIEKLKTEIKSGLAHYGKYKTTGMSIDPVP